MTLPCVLQLHIVGREALDLDGRDTTVNCCKGAWREVPQDNNLHCCRWPDLEPLQLRRWQPVHASVKLVKV